MEDLPYVAHQSMLPQSNHLCNKQAILLVDMTSGWIHELRNGNRLRGLLVSYDRMDV